MHGCQPLSQSGSPKKQPVHLTWGYTHGKCTARQCERISCACNTITLLLACEFGSRSLVHTVARHAYIHRKFFLK